MYLFCFLHLFLYVCINKNYIIMEKQWLLNMEIGESFTVSDMGYTQIMNIVRQVPGNFVVTELEDNQFMVVRGIIKDRTKTSDEFKDLLNGLHDSCEIELHAKQQVNVNAEVSYLRSMLSRYNTENGRSIKLSCVGGLVFISEKVEPNQVVDKLLALSNKAEEEDLM